MVTKIIGIDPGFTGAASQLIVKNNQWVLNSLDPMPLAKTGSVLEPQKGARDIIDANSLAAMIYGVAPEISTADNTIAVVERVAASPQMGVASSFRFGEGYGIIQGILVAMRIKSFFIHPAVWKAGMELSADKNRSLELAGKIFPSHASLFHLRKNDGLAEAALLAEYGRRFLLPKNLDLCNS